MAYNVFLNSDTVARAGYVNARSEAALRAGCKSEVLRE
jgi:hypothetical protein